MRNFFRICIIILCVLSGLTGCDFSSQSSSEFFAMDTVMTITAYGSGSKQALSSAEKAINKLDLLFSVQNENSEIFMLNESKSVTASEDTLALVNRSMEISKQTDGAFDITTGVLSDLWGFNSNSDCEVPCDNEIETALESVGIDNIEISGEKIMLSGGASIDLGAIAKGYASSKSAEILKENGVESALISLGGNVRAVGSKPDGSDWVVGIADPDNPSEQIGSLTVSDTAVITSGGYQRYFEQDGKVYHHIIDPETGYPAESGLKSVTVVSDDDTLADALSTALFVMGLDKATEFYRENNSLFGAVFVDDNGEVYVTDNICGSFSSDSEFEVINI